MCQLHVLHRVTVFWPTLGDTASLHWTYMYHKQHCSQVMYMWSPRPNVCPNKGQLVVHVVHVYVGQAQAQISSRINTYSPASSDMTTYIYVWGYINSRGSIIQAYIYAQMAGSLLAESASLSVPAPNKSGDRLWIRPVTKSHSQYVRGHADESRYVLRILG